MAETVIFWDFDGTLVRSNQSFLSSLLRAFEAQELPMDRDVAQAFLQKSCSWYFPGNLFEDRTGEAWWEDLLGKVRTFSADHHVPEEKIPGILTAFREHVISYPYALYEDAVSTLRACREAGGKNFILSNNFPELRQIIVNLGLSPYLSDVFLSSELGAEKPNPLIFKKALALAGMPSAAFMVGDNPIADIKGARQAGLKTVLVHRDGQADFVLPSLQQIPPCIFKD